MKKTLILMRHATAEEGSTVFKDIERELTSAGYIESARMGKQLLENIPSQPEVYCSPATRAQRTAEIVVEQFKLSVVNINTEENLYGSGPRGYLSTLNKLSESFSTVIIIGHNPDISYFTEYLCREDMGGSLLPASAVQISFENLRWEEISQKSGVLQKRFDVNSIS
jgi:phosphohistidine phosphatase